MPEQTTELRDAFRVLSVNPLVQPPTVHRPAQIAHLVHTHIWTVDIHLHQLPAEPRHLNFYSPSIGFRPEMLPALPYDPQCQLTIDVDHRNGHRIRVLPPAWHKQHVAFHTTIRLAEPAQLAWPSARLSAYGCLTAQRSERPIQRLPVGTERVTLRHCVTYRSHGSSRDRLRDQLGSVQPQRTWQQSTIHAPSHGPLFRGAGEARQHFTLPAAGRPDRTGRVQPAAYETAFHVPHAAIASQPWHLHIRRNRQPGPAALALHVLPSVGFHMGGAAIRVAVHSVHDPLIARQTVELRPLPPVSLANYKQATPPVPLHRIRNAALLERMDRGEPLACTVTATTAYMVSATVAAQRRHDGPAMQQYYADLRALLDRCGRTGRTPATTMPTLTATATATLSAADKALLKRRVHRLQGVFGPLLDDAASADWWLRLRGGQTTIAVHKAVLMARAPQLCAFLRDKWPDGQRRSVFDVDVLCLTEAGLRRLLGHIYGLDAVQAGDEELQLMCVAHAMGLVHLAHEAMQCWLNELPAPAPEEWPDRRACILGLGMWMERRRLREWRAPADGAWREMADAERSVMVRVMERGGEERYGEE